MHFTKQQRIRFLHRHSRRSFKIFEEPKALESYENTNASGIPFFLSEEVSVARIFSVQYLSRFLHSSRMSFSYTYWRIFAKQQIYDYVRRRFYCGGGGDGGFHLGSTILQCVRFMGYFHETRSSVTI